MGCLMKHLTCNLEEVELQMQLCKCKKKKKQSYYMSYGKEQSYELRGTVGLL